MGRDESYFQNRVIIAGAAFLICMLLLSAYSNTLYTPFILDDLHSFVREPKVLGFTFDLAGFKHLASTKFGVRRFLPMLTFALDIKWGGGSLAAFHMTNIVIHLLATFSLLFFLQSLFLHPQSRSIFQGERNRKLATVLLVAVVGLWSLNPVQTNAVTYIVQRMTSIATLFYFLSLGSYLRARFHHRAYGLSKRALFFYLSSLLCFVLAMMSKEIAATLPVIVFLIEWLLVEDSGLFTALEKHKITVALLSALIIGIVGYKLSQGWMLGGYAKRHFILSERLLTELRVVSSYCFLLLLPLPRWLNLEHDVSLSTSLFSPFTTFTSLIFIVITIIIAWKLRNRNPLITFGIYWFFINLLIESTVIPLELKFEHRLYLSSAGFYLGLVFGLYEFYRYFNGNKLSLDGIKIIFCTIVIVCSGLSFLTYTRNVVWADTVSIYSDCVAKAPGKARSHSNLATAWLRKGEYEKALSEAEKAIILGVKGYEEYWVAACDIINSLARMGDLERAISRGESLLSEAPEGTKKNAYPEFIFNLGEIYFAANDLQKAFNYFLDGYKLCYRNDLPEVLGFEQSMVMVLEAGLQQKFQFDSSMNLNWKNPKVAVDEKMAQIFFDLYNLDLASKYVDKIMAKDGTSPVASKVKKEIERISAANTEQKKFGTLKEKYFFHPFASQFHFYMAICFAMEKYNLPGDSFLHYCVKRAETLNSSSPDVYIVKSWYYYKHGNQGTALKIIKQGLKLNSKYAQLWVNRGIYALADKNIEAFTDFDRALRLYPGHPHRREILAMQSLAAKLTDLN